MYLDTLDPVRTSEYQHDIETCQKYAIQGEAMLLKTLLEGNRPTLTQTQVMDSKVIHNILWDPEARDPFLSFIKNGHINVALYKNLKANNIQSLQNYFLQTLQKGLKEDESFHHYSCLPFMQELDDCVRIKFQRKITDALTNNYYNFTVDGVNPKYVEYMEAYVKNLHLLDWELRGQFVGMGPFTKSFDHLFIEGCHILASNELVSEEILQLCEDMLRQQKFHNTRSIYYHFLEEHANSTPKAKEFVKNLVDICYNESIASTLPNSECNISIERHLKNLISCTENTGNILSKEKVLLIPKRSEKYFTWEALKFLFQEIDNLQEKKNLSRLEAIEDYRSQTKLQLPVMKTAKYLTVGLATSLIPFGEDLIEIVTNSLGLVTDDVLSEVTKKPSLRDISNEIIQNNEQKVMAKKAHEFTLITKRSS